MCCKVLEYHKISNNYPCGCEIIQFYFVFTFSEVHAEEAVLARLSYSAYMRAVEARLKAANKLTVRQIIKISLIFCFIVSHPQVMVWLSRILYTAVFLLTLWTPEDGIPTLRKLPYAARMWYTVGTVFYRTRQKMVYLRHGV